MTLLITAVVLGLLFAYIAIQNTVGVPLQIGPYKWSSLPLYGILVGSLLMGLMVAWLMSMIDSVASAMMLRRKDKHIHQTEAEINSLQQKIHELERENVRLEEKKKVSSASEHSELRGDLLSKVKHSIPR